MIVDDEKNLAELISDFCQLADFEAKIVTDSTQALQTALDWKPDIVTLDLEMPKMDGVEVLKQLQANETTRRIPVVVVSVVAQMALVNGFLEGAASVFEKPLRVKILVEKIQKLLTGKSNSAPLRVLS